MQKAAGNEPRGQRSMVVEPSAGPQVTTTVCGSQGSGSSIVPVRVAESFSLMAGSVVTLATIGANVLERKYSPSVVLSAATRT